MSNIQDPYTKRIYSSDGRNISGIEAYKNMSFMRSYLIELVQIWEQVKPIWMKGTTIDQNGVTYRPVTPKELKEDI